MTSVFAMNALAFVLVLFAVLTWKRKSEVLDTPLESFFDSLAGAVRYMRYARAFKSFCCGILLSACSSEQPQR